MNPEVIAHLLSLCANRRAEIFSAIKLARAAGLGQCPQVAGLLAEQLLNDGAIAELTAELQVAA